MKTDEQVRRDVEVRFTQWTCRDASSCDDAALAAREVDGVTLELLGANAILRGRVRSWDNRYQAEMATRSLQGVHNVRNEIRVQCESVP